MTPDVARPRAQRLLGLNPTKRTAGATWSGYTSATTKRKALPAPPPPVQKQRPKCCPTPNISDEDGSALCYSCGTVFQEHAMSSEVTFGENAAGAATVDGGYIADNQRHANSMGGTVRGIGGMPSRDQAAQQGKTAITALASSLHVRQAVMDQAVAWYNLAINQRFIQGRRMRNVAAVAIYMAARRQPENTLMLMDLAEKIQTNVWALGDTYKAFLKMLGEKDPAKLVGNKAVQEIEPLMLKYCRKLEFGQDSHKVADDACKLLKCMSRDWMVQGRQPAGICGACIILAARMNNFRRTTREVVYVVKVADSTINSRLYEFKRTPSSVLSVKQFREFGQRMKVKTQPPAIWRRAEKEGRKEKRKSAGESAGQGDDTEVAVVDQAGNIETEAGLSTQAPTRASKRRKSNNGTSQAVTTQSRSPTTQGSNPAVTDVHDHDGNNDAVVDIVGNALIEAGETNDPDFVMPPKRGRPSKKRDPIVISPEDLEIEQDIESELNHVIRDWESTFKEFASNENHDLLRRTGWTARQMTQAYTDTRDVPVSLSPDIAEEEFEDDPDVANCILGPSEVRRKEAIWITENEDWLRDQQKKMLEAELEKAQDKPKKPKQKRRHHQMGDGSVLEGHPAASAAEAAHKMLKKRAKPFSNHINYDKLKELFPGGNAATTPSGSGQGASPAVSQLTTSPPVVQVTDGDAGGDDEEEEHEEEENEELQEADEEEEFDDPNQYMDDDDEGFGNENYDDY